MHKGQSHSFIRNPIRSNNGCHPTELVDDLEKKCTTNEDKNHSTETTPIDYEKWNKTQLYSKCKDMGIKGMSGKPKHELIKRLNETNSSGGAEI